VKIRRRLFHWSVATVLFGVVGVVFYFALAGRTDFWPVSPCTVVNHRVIRADVPVAGYRVVILYRGQFQLQYFVNDKPYLVWANTTWVDSDPDFLNQKLDAQPESRCEYSVRYNPRNPAEAVAVWKGIESSWR
jgi:hypothetical protein